MMDSKPTLNTFKYSSPQQPVFRVIETPLHYRSYPQQNNTTLEDLSFSSYLKENDHTKPEVEDTEISIFDAQKYFSSEINDAKQQDQPPQGTVVSSIPRLSSVSSVDGYGNKFNYRTRSFHATPTASSEASWNSQTGLLTNPPGVMGVSMKSYHQEKKKINNSVAKKKWIFGQKCCCTGQKAVRVKGTSSDSEHDTPRPVVMSTHNNIIVNTGKSNVKRDCHKEKEASVLSPRTPSIATEILKIHQHKLMPPNPLILSPENDFTATNNSLPRQQRVSASGGFSFPVLNQTTKSTVVAKPVNLKGINAKKTAAIRLMEDPPRDSIDVFQPSTDNPVVTRLPYNNPGSPLNGRVANTDDDAGSDASSDLFEIESFSTQSTSYPMYRRRDSLDEAQTFNARKLALLQNNIVQQQQHERNSLDEPPTPSVAATECYAPSEASIAWSVTTAEGFDRASVSNFSMSASQVGGGDDHFPATEELIGVVWDSGKIKKGSGSTGLLMMSCRHEKAVSVGPQPVKYMPINNNSNGDGISAGFPMNGGGRPPRAANKPPHSARLSLAFAA